MSFGLSNVPASFPGYINKIVAKKLNIFFIVYLNKIFIYTKDASQAHINAIQWVLEELRKNNLFANLKECCFHKNKVCFLQYVMSAQEIQMEEKRIDVVKNWLEPKPICDIQVFLGFANFYCCFLQSFSRIAAPPTSMLKISSIVISATQKLMDLVYEFGEIHHSENEARKTSASTKEPTGADYLFFDYVSRAISIFVSNSAKNVSNYLTPDTKRAFDQLYQAFTEALILQHFDPEQYIWVETDASRHVIGGVMS